MHIFKHFNHSGRQYARVTKPASVVKVDSLYIHETLKFLYRRPSGEFDIWLPLGTDSEKTVKFYLAPPSKIFKIILVYLSVCSRFCVPKYFYIQSKFWIFNSQNVNEITSNSWNISRRIKLFIISVACNIHLSSMLD